MTSRRLCCTVLIFSLATSCFAQRATSELFTADVLKKELFARTNEERQFCDYVIKKRDDGTIPERIIYAVYRKAITQDQKKRFLFFKNGLEILCRQEGIVLYPTSVKTTPKTSSVISSLFKKLF